ncbi:acyltransferase family protein [Hyunsoonleella rubra]|uniref:Acyltransferase family protein n=1 Tax=Hyunsoonleella rubra TaxID=1737062 RepID=A0ABW5TFE5_9FLAO
MNRNNNFDFLRFLFAIFVVLSHSYPLSGSSETYQWIYQITNGQIVLARIGLGGFFIISGFFIFKSLKRSKSLSIYFWKRFLRLFPALFVVLLLTVLLLPFVYEGGVSLYENPEVYTYLPNNLSLYGFQSIIQGVFDNNPYHSINGSLWTIRYEFSLYVALSLLFFVKNNYKLVRGVLFLTLVFLLVIYNFLLGRFAGSSIFGMLGYEILDLGTFFVCGSVLAAFNFERVKSPLLLVLSVLTLIGALHFEVYHSVKHILLPVVILLLGQIPLPFFSTFGKIGDMSYGIYIYSFPVQQTLVYFFKLGTYELMFWSVIISIVLGFCSWHLIEKKALSYKNVSISKSKIELKKKLT